jgi:hypothetical protein
MKLEAMIDLKKITPLHLILLMGVLQLVFTLLSDGFVLSFDEALWAYIGRNWFRHGLVPYSGGVDSQSPLFFALFGLSDKLFGVNYWFPRVVGTVCQTIGLYYLYKIANRFAGKQAGMLAITFYGLSVLWHAAGGKYVSYTETYEVMFTIIAIYYFIKAESKGELLIVGLIAGVGLVCRISAFFVIAAIFCVSLYQHKFKAVFFCAGVILSYGVFLGIWALLGIDLHNMYIYDFADNFNSGSPYDHGFIWKLQQFSDKFLYTEIIQFYPLVIAYFLIKKNFELIGLWLIFAFGGIVFIGEFTWLHLKEILPGMSLMSALTVNHLVSHYKVPLRPLMIIIWITFFPKVVEPLINLKNLIRHKTEEEPEFCKPPFIRPGDESRKRMGWWVRDHTSVNEKVFVAGFGSQIQVYSERQSVYFNQMQTPLAKKKLFEDMLNHKPEMILIPLFPEYKDYIQPDVRQFVDDLAAEYYTLNGCMYNYKVYNLRR